MGRKIFDDEDEARIHGEAVQCMKRFFMGKPYYDHLHKQHRELLPEILISPATLKIVVNAADFDMAMDIANEGIADHLKQGKFLALSKASSKEQEAALYIQLLQNCKQLEIPKSFHGGMILLYLWLCEGVEFK